MGGAGSDASIMPRSADPRGQLISGARDTGGLYQVRVTEYSQPAGVGNGICRALAYYWVLLMLRPGILGLATTARGPTQQQLLATLDARWRNFDSFIYRETTLRDDNIDAGHLQTLFADGLSLEFFVVHRLTIATPAVFLGAGDGLRAQVTAKRDRATGFVLSIRFPSPNGQNGHTMAVWLDRNRAYFFEPNLGVFHFTRPEVLCYWIEHQYLPFFEGVYGRVHGYRLVRVRPIKPAVGARQPSG
jgi:hypothetical protein